MDSRGQAAVGLAFLAMLLLITLVYGLVQPQLLDLNDRAEAANSDGLIGDSHAWFETILMNFRLLVVLVGVVALLAAGLAQGAFT